MSVVFGSEDGAGNAATGFRFDLHGQYLTPQGFGGYGLLPLSYVAFDNDAFDDTFALGNLELGGLFVVPTETVTFVARGGLTLPTAGDDADAFLANVAGLRPRLTDVVSVLPDTLWLRLSGSALYTRDKLFVRADLGFDVPLDDTAQIDLGVINFEFDVDTLFRFNLAAGYQLGPAAVMLELVNLVNTADDDPDPNNADDDVEHNLTIAGRYLEGPVQPSLSLVFALDESARDDIDFMLMLGVHFEL